MYSSLIRGLSVLLAALALACERPPTAPTLVGAPVVRGLNLLDAPAPITSVDIKSEHLTGMLPNGVPVEVRLKATAEGADPLSLAGEGRHFASTGAHNYWSATGSTNGNNVTLSGTVAESNTPFLIGSPVGIVADATTGAVSLTFGPLSGGPFVGQTLVFTGTGKVSITAEQ